MPKKAKDSNAVKVLIVESEKVARIRLKYALKQCPDIEIAGETANGDEVIHLIDNIQPDIVLLDLVFTGVRGIDTLLKIKERRKETKVIILSSLKSEDEIIYSLIAGASACCMNDISIEDLAMAIKAVHQGACWLDSSAAAITQKYFKQQKNLENNNVVKIKTNNRNLTKRELQVLQYIVDGKSNLEIADGLCISIHTVKAHVCNILRKFEVDDRLLAAVQAVREGLVN